MAKVELDEIAGPDGGDESRRLARFWLDQISSIKDSSQYKHWVKRSESIIKRYRDERNRTDEEGQRRYNALWANVEILKPALYGKTPLPVAERRFKDKDPAGRGAAMMLERALRNEIEICGYNEALTKAVSDYLLPGRGTVWVRYEPEIEESVSLPPETSTDMRDAQGELPGTQTPPTEQETTTTTPGGRKRPKIINQEPQEPQDEDKEHPDEEEPETPKDEEEEKLRDTGDRIVRESTPIDFVEWCDFFIFPMRARCWAEVTGVGKLIYMSRDQTIRRFGKEIGRRIPLEKDTRGDRVQNTMLQTGDEDKCKVYEIWNKDDEKIYWVAFGYDYLCDRKDDPLTLEHFFPCPCPLFANPTNNTIIPVPDFIQYQDQAIQIDKLTQRIAMLTDACKMTGLYNASQKDIQRIFNESIENELIPVDDWAAFAEKGGIEGNWSLMPVQVIKDVINELMMVKEKQIEEMDRLTGINDIMRGTSDARETLGGVRLKTNNTGTRLTARQNEVARFARDTVRIMADIMCQHFSPQSLIDVSGALYEEGLGPDDMPPLTQLNSSASGPPPGAAPAQGARPGLPPPAPGTPSGPVPPGGATQPPVPSTGAPPGPPQGAPGTNIVPFRPPQPPSAPGMPPSGPQMAPGAGQPPQPPPQDPKIAAFTRIAKAIQLLRTEKTRGFRVDIEVDSTIFADAAQEKQDRTEFVTRVTQFIGQSMQLGAQMPESIPLLGKLLLFGVRGYRIGRDLEMAIEEFTDAAVPIAKQAQANASSQNPEMAKVQIEREKAQAQIQGIQMKSQSEDKSAQAEIQRQQLESQGEAQTGQMDIQIKQMDLKMREMEMQIEAMRAENEKALEGMRMQTEQQSLHNQAQKSQMELHTQQQSNQMQLHADQQKHQQNMQVGALQANQKAQQAMQPPQPAQPRGPAQPKRTPE